MEYERRATALRQDVPTRRSLGARAAGHRIVIDDLDDGGKRDLYDLSVGTFDFDAGRG